MRRLIDGDALYEKASNLEAQALDYAVKISNDEEKREEWIRWSAILAERTAFKHDVYDAPTIELERKTGRWTKAYDGNDDHVKCTGCFKTYDWISQAQYYNYCPNCGAYMGGDTEWLEHSSSL